MDTPITRPIMYVSDPSSLATNMLPNPVVADDLHRIVDITADAGIDLYCQDMYSQCCSAYWRGETCDYDAREQHKRFIPMLDEGIVPAAVLAEQCHRRGMRFIAGIRVNDNHGYKELRGGRYPWVGGPIREIIEQHPDWELTTFDPEWGTNDNYALDFSVPGVRTFTADVVGEIIDRFDIDGVELCFRDSGYFPFGQGPEGAPLMTNMIRDIRARLDCKAKSTGRELLLGTRVGWPLMGCLEMGLDVAAWVEEGLIQYLAPMDGMWTDLDFPFDAFADLTRDRSCQLWPGLHPWASQRSRIRLKAQPLTEANMLAYAHSLYRRGADGISLFNWCVVTRSQPYYPQMLQVCHALKNPETVSARPRHYVYEPIWSGLHDHVEASGMRRYSRADHIVLDRAIGQPKGEASLYFDEEVDQVLLMQILFRGHGLSEIDELEVSFNGEVIDDRDIDRTRRCDSTVDSLRDPRIAKDGRAWRCGQEDRTDIADPPPSLSSRWFKLDSAIAKHGCNTLSIRLREGDSELSGNIVIDEFEIWVTPK